MPSHTITKLSDCSEFRQHILSRPPVIVHSTVFLLVGLMIAAVGWAALTEADLVVRAAGRVRPMTAVKLSADSAAEESKVAPLESGRVAAVYVTEGERVREGDPLIQFDQREILTQISKHERAIATAETEIARSRQMQQLLLQRHRTAKGKAEAELAQADQEISRAKLRRATDIQLAQLEVTTTQDLYERVLLLRKDNAVAEAEYVASQAKFRTAQLNLENAELPVDEGKIQVLREAQELVEREYRVELSRLETQQALKQAELDTASLELSRLKLHQQRLQLLAPCDGVITSLTAKVGEVVEAGITCLTVVDLRGFRIDVSVASEDVGHLREGMPVRVKLDAYDFQKYGTLSGRVAFISPDSDIAGASPSTSKPAYTVKIALDSQTVGRGQLQGQVKLGMTGQVEIITERESIFLLLLRSIRRSISLG